jgi:hypothetical protein
MIKVNITDKNPNKCEPIESCCSDHIHGPNCGHEQVVHGDHVDYIVDGRLHHPHQGHCDDHGSID